MKIEREEVDGMKFSTKQLKANRWRLVSPSGQYAGLDNGAKCKLVSRDYALVFDGRDNETMKIRYWSAVLKVQFEMEFESCAC